MTLERPFPLGTVRLDWGAGDEFCAAINPMLVTEWSEHRSVTGLPVKQSSVSEVRFDARLSTFLPPGYRLRVESAVAGVWFDALVVARDVDGVTRFCSDSVLHELTESDEPHVVRAG